MESSNFMSKNDNRSLDILENMFKPTNYKWFVESKNSNKWVNIYDNSFNEEDLTSDPNLARAFNTRIQALTFIVKYHLSERFIETEHEFVEYK